MSHANARSQRRCRLPAHVACGLATEGQGRTSQGRQTRQALGVPGGGFGGLPTLALCWPRASAVEWL